MQMNEFMFSTEDLGITVVVLTWWVHHPSILYCLSKFINRSRVIEKVRSLRQSLEINTQNICRTRLVDPGVEP